MAFERVRVTWDEKNSSLINTAGTITFTLSGALTDTTGEETVSTSPVAYNISAGGTGPLVANDSNSATPLGTFYYVTVAPNVGTPYSFRVNLNRANGASQRLSALASVVDGGPLVTALSPAVVSLTFGASIAVDASQGNVFAVTLTSSAGTLVNPTNPVDGQTIRFRVIQDATGSRTLSYGNAYDFGAVGAPVLSTSANKVDILGFEYVAALSKWCYLGSGLGF